MPPTAEGHDVNLQTKGNMMDDENRCECGVPYGLCDECNDSEDDKRDDFAELEHMIWERDTFGDK